MLKNWYQIWMQVTAKSIVNLYKCVRQFFLNFMAFIQMRQKLHKLYFQTHPIKKANIYSPIPRNNPPWPPARYQQTVDDWVHIARILQFHVIHDLILKHSTKIKVNEHNLVINWKIIIKTHTQVSHRRMWLVSFYARKGVTTLTVLSK